jgi:hypothetical protein
MALAHSPCNRMKGNKNLRELKQNSESKARAKQWRFSPARQWLEEAHVLAHLTRWLPIGHAFRHMLHVGRVLVY